MSKKIDPKIYMPPVAGYEYKESFTDGGGEGSSAPHVELPNSTPEGLQPPQNVRVVEQVYRRDAAGKTVVDLIIEVEDMPGATEYEIRTSAA